MKKAETKSTGGLFGRALQAVEKRGSAALRNWVYPMREGVVKDDNGHSFNAKISKTGKCAYIYDSRIGGLRRTPQKLFKGMSRKHRIRMRREVIAGMDRAHPIKL